ncbi:AAA family ATPase [Deinococcus sp. AJ005]|uniref:AAA family ATPase n=1 Tax=Deinococcus sp. AJ005 TaxID=2652443 RepID=UPI00125CBEE9|nr:AAA family ATPase [Deinococcus sp. AJ005]QFP75063.1 AAA family ATPase [Deinococcus sp. AJ005]
MNDVTCFSRIDMDFVKDDKPARWIIILGENGTGKSTILKMLALSLLGDRMSLDIVDRVQIARFKRNSSKSLPSTLLKVTPNTRDKNKIRGKTSYSSVFIIYINSGRNTGVKLGIPATTSFVNGEAEFDRLSKTMHSEDITSGWFSAGYGPWRRAPSTVTTGRRDDHDILLQTKSGRFASLFIDDISLSTFSNWIIDLEYRVLKDPSDAWSKNMMDIAISVLEISLKGLKFEGISQNREILFKGPDGIIAMEQLSDGYRSIAAWSGDLAKRLIEAYPESKDPLREEGVVLIDEIDIHLHPKWQREIVEHTRELFPNLQFIVTSHSPFVAQDVTDEDKLFITYRNENGVDIKEWDIPIGGWRVDQILTSKLFGLKTTRNENIETKEVERKNLLESMYNPKILFSKEDEDKLKKVEKWLDDNRSAPVGEDFGGFYSAADKFLDLLEKKVAKENAPSNTSTDTDDS